MSTEFPSKNGINRQWHVIDAQEAVLGKLASKAAMLLMGKNKPSYTPFLDTGDHVIVINAEQSPAHGPERREQGLPSFHGLSRRAGGNQLQAGARDAADADRGRGHSGHASRRPSSANRCTGS